ncbi:hypothetical protein QQM39_43185 [Streptomyces sp. DT2A-34]|uniref:hypothetical protein n=1 Tax=Streptomyces sp. DT2A-34 TaxID=3051182 RepID=UPI00265BDE67|nr:hypothetical protein [Streptomyces sp. DT2A-34]MDO0917365.1 hypothetical protein [Streptomyces sp. DT2A-34]
MPPASAPLRAARPSLGGFSGAVALAALAAVAMVAAGGGLVGTRAKQSAAGRYSGAAVTTSHVRAFVPNRASAPAASSAPAPMPTLRRLPVNANQPRVSAAGAACRISVRCAV